MVSELEQKLGEARTEASQLKEKLSLAEEELEANETHLNRAQMDLKSLQDAQEDQKEDNTRLREKLSRLEVSILTNNTAKLSVFGSNKHIKHNWTSSPEPAAGQCYRELRGRARPPH